LGRGKTVTSNITNIAKILRKRSTDTERLLWRYLRIRQIEGLKFRRQEPIGNYIADFVCFESKMVIEVDGGQHTASEKDTERDAWLQSQGFKVLRFWNHEVLTNIEGVLEVIRHNCLESRNQDHPPLTPPIKGGATTGGESNL
jgi:very-short-patch-repair endonuclease